MVCVQNFMYILVRTVVSQTGKETLRLKKIYTFILFTYGLFNDAASSSDHTASSDPLER
jgi:hypothetical protein